MWLGCSQLRSHILRELLKREPSKEEEAEAPGGLQDGALAQMLFHWIPLVNQSKARSDSIKCASQQGRG